MHHSLQENYSIKIVTLSNTQQCQQCKTNTYSNDCRRKWNSCVTKLAVTVTTSGNYTTLTQSNMQLYGKYYSTAIIMLLLFPFSYCLKDHF